MAGRAESDDATEPHLPIRSPSRRPAEYYCEPDGSPYTIPLRALLRPADVAVRAGRGSPLDWIGC